MLLLHHCVVESFARAVFRLFLGTSGLGASGGKLVADVDADWLPNYGTEFDNWKSTSGYHVNNANAAVTWRSKRQDVIATSTPHAECLAAYEVIRDVILMRGLKADMGHEEPHPTVLQEDNQTLVRTSS